MALTAQEALSAKVPAPMIGESPTRPHALSAMPPVDVPAAMRLGATREEIMEILSVTVLMGGGPSLMYAAHVMEVVDEELAARQSES